MICVEPLQAAKLRNPGHRVEQSKEFSRLKYNKTAVRRSAEEVVKNVKVCSAVLELASWNIATWNFQKLDGIVFLGIVSLKLCKKLGCISNDD